MLGGATPNTNTAVSGNNFGGALVLVAAEQQSENCDEVVSTADHDHPSAIEQVVACD